MGKTDDVKLQSILTKEANLKNNLSLDYII